MASLARLCIAASFISLGHPALAASGTPAAKAGPPVIPYLCHDGRAASVVYENGSGSRHARALVTYDGHTYSLGQAPALYGVRYRGASEGEAEGGEPFAWTLRGEEAWLTRSAREDGYTIEEPAVARCVRLRGAAPHAPGHEAEAGRH